MLTREKRLTLKRTRRNAWSKKKRTFRNRGMSPQFKFRRIGIKARRASVMAASALPLRGVRADLRSTIPASKVPLKKGFFARLFRRTSA